MQSKKDYENATILNKMGRRKEISRVSSDGVFFRCDRCNYAPEMASKTDDLLNMNYCPECGVKFKPVKKNPNLKMKL